MMDVHSDIIQFKGTHYDFGFKQGGLLRGSPILKKRKGLLKSRKRHFSINQDTFKTVIDEFAPLIWEEIYGLADALGLQMEDAIREFGGYYLEYGKSGCSIFTDKNYMVRNYDNHPESYEGRYVIYEPIDGGYATVGPSMQITGRTDGMNEKGLVIGYNFINRRQSRDGFMCNMIGRIVLENCANAKEAIQLLKEIPHRQSFSYVLLDPHGVTYIVEASPRRIEVRQGYVCTNHFEEVTEENRYRMDDSMRRTKAIQNQQQHLKNPYEAFQMMNDVDKGVFSNKYGAWAGTLHTAIYFPKELRVGISLGGSQAPLLFTFEQLFHSKQMRVKQIKGNIDSDLSFINV